MLEEAQKQDVLELCQALIRARSYSGEEREAVSVLKRYMEIHGFDEVEVDGYGNILGCIRGRRPGPRLLFDGHVDTVSVGRASDWTFPPFEAVVEKDKLYGRGASDMKGAVAAFTAAAAAYARRTDRDFSGELYVAGIVHEECFEGVAARAVSARVRPDYVVIGEASGLDLKIGQRGRTEVVVETFGVPAHSANPHKGVNAVYGMCRLIDAIQKLEPVEHSFLGKGILELTDIKSSPYPGASVVPEYCRATFDRRLVVGETRESVLAPLQALLERCMAQQPSLKARVFLAEGREACYTGQIIEGERFFPAWVHEPGEPFITQVLDRLRAQGFNPAITRYDFCTNGSHYAGEAGIKTLGLGPSFEHLAHIIDEYVELDQLYGAMVCYGAIMEALVPAGGDPS